jgi:hypothetical protein
MERENNPKRYERAVIQVEAFLDMLHALSDSEYLKAMKMLTEMLEEEEKDRVARGLTKPQS